MTNTDTHNGAGGARGGWRWVVCVLVFGLVAGWCGAETLPARPAAYFNDYAGIVPVARARALDVRLAQFDQETSAQIVVAVFPRRESRATLEDYTLRVARSWGVGQKAYDNGVVLFAFMAERELRIEVGSGLEGRLSNATCAGIIARELAPRFRAGDFAGGFDGAVTALMTAVRGDYRGSGGVELERSGVELERGASVTDPGGGGRVSGVENPYMGLIVFGAIILCGLKSVFGSGSEDSELRGSVGRRSGWRLGGGSSRGGGGFSSGGGGFRGGGGGFRGGGASGKW